MRLFAVFGLLAGLLVAIALVIAEGAGAIWHSASLIGVAGFLGLLVYRLGLLACMGLSWWGLGADRLDSRWPRYAWGRIIRDSAGDILPLSQIGGFAVGARALTLAGVNGAFAAGSTVVDVTLELIGQLGYVLLGVGLLHVLRPEAEAVLPALAAVGGMGVAVGVFLAVQARGAGLAEAALRRMASLFLGGSGGGSSVQAVIQHLHGQRGRLCACAAGHCLWWVMSGVETWLTFRLMGLHVGMAAALVVDSFLYGVRSLAFVVPNAFGVQEGALMVLAGLFGVGHAPALAMSLVKRARDLAIGVPALLIWQWAESRLALRRQAVRADAA